MDHHRQDVDRLRGVTAFEQPAGKTLSAKKGARVLTAMCLSKSAGVVSRIEPRSVVAAAQTSALTARTAPPRCRSEAIASSVRPHVAVQRSRPRPAARRCEAAASPSGARRHRHHDAATAFGTSRSAMASPRPCVPPEMTAVVVLCQAKAASPFPDFTPVM